MGKKIVITLARQYGCGGRTVSRMVAEKLGLNYYDKDLINLAAERNGVDSEFYKHFDEKAGVKFASMFSMSSPNSYFIPVYNDIQINDKLFYTQADIIKKAAEESSCIIVGRCADYVLRDMPNVINIFLHANLECRKKRLVEKYGVTDKNIDKVIAKADKQRAAYYNTYTDLEWGDVKNYNLTINTSHLTLEQVADIIVTYVKVYMSNIEE